MLESINDNKPEINPLFFRGLEKFRNLLRTCLVPKNSFNDGELVTGEGKKILKGLNYVYSYDRRRHRKFF